MWYLEKGKDNSIVFNVNVNYSRNFRNFKFGSLLKSDVEKIEDEVKSKLPSLGYNLKFCKMQNIDDIGRNALLEKGIINLNFAKDKDKIYSMLINEDESIVILLNEENHLKIQTFQSGFDLESAYSLAKEIDEKIEQNFDIAKSEKYGYLTTCLDTVGTGLKITATLHLPGLTKTGNIRKILDTLNSFGMILTNKYVDDGKQIGDIYLLTNKQTLGISEDNIVKNFKIIAEKIIEQEKQARKILAKNQYEIEDMVYRSYGLLLNARILKEQEAFEILSNVKLGVDLGIIQELTDEKILKLYYYIKPNILKQSIGENLDNYDINIKRAEMVKKVINEK